MKFALDTAAICSQLLGHFVWPLTLDTSANIWFLPLSILLISLRSWENFVVSASSSGEFNLLLFFFSLHFYSRSLTCHYNEKFIFQLTFNCSQSSRRISTILATKFTCCWHRWKLSRLYAARYSSPASSTTNLYQHFQVIWQTSPFMSKKWDLL